MPRRKVPPPVTGTGLIITEDIDSAMAGWSIWKGFLYVPGYAAGYSHEEIRSLWLLRQMRWDYERLRQAPVQYLLEV